MTKKEKKTKDLMCDIQESAQVTEANKEEGTELFNAADPAFKSVIETLHTSNIHVIAEIINAAAGKSYRPDNRTDQTKAALSQLKDFSPRSQLEAMLTAQIIAVNSAIAKTMARAMLPDQHLATREAYVTMTTKLQRTFLAQVEMLQKLQGKGQQKVVVEHVHVYKGGQAIVGNLEHHKVGGGDEGENGK